MARKYKRDSNGRFAGGGGGSSGGGSKRPAAKTVSRGVNRLTRDNAGKITSVGGSGATARGGRLRTAAGNKRATVTAKVAGGSPAGTIKGKVKRDPGAAGKVGQGKAAAAPKPTAAAKPARKPKTDEQVMQQADRTMSKLAKRMASIQVDKVGLTEGLRQVRRNNARAGRVKTALAKRGLLEKYTKLTAPADAIRMTPAGKGIKQPKAKPTTTPKPNVRAKQGGGTTAKIKPAAAAPKPATTAKNRASQMRERAAQLDQRGNALMGGGRRDTAAVNLSLNSRARRNETNAGFKGLEMTRNAERLRSKAGRIEYRSNESRAKKLRSVHETPIAKAFAKKAGKSVTEVRAAIRSMTPEKQIKMFKQHVKETRSAAGKRKP